MPPDGIDPLDTPEFALDKHRRPPEPRDTAVIVRPGDYVAVICDRPLSRAEMTEMKTELIANWPDVKVAIFSGGVTALQVLRPEDD